MIFNLSNESFESEKERNLYYKIFAGYFFNELISGWEKRLQDFQKLINDKNSDSIYLSPENTHISFDNHSYGLLSNDEKDRGEFADILIQDVKNKVIIAIEAKYLSDWEYEKDICKNKERIDKVKKKLGYNKSIQCLLLKQSKWEEAEKREKQTGSNYAKLKKNKSSVTIVFWEEIIDLCDEGIVISYLKKQLNKTK
jgi:hypothetical protein